MLEARRAIFRAAMLAAAVLLAAGCGGSSPSHKPAVSTGASFGKLGGYIEQVPVDSVGASWRVAAIATHSQPGFAATWIGAQHGFGGPPFIQVGTNAILVQGHPAIYFTFWSDVRRHFNPQHLFFVKAGDVVVASLERSRGGWLVKVRDTTNGHAASFLTSEEGSGRFEMAEWLQEDPGKSLNGSSLPYPRLGQVAFSEMVVNSRRPSYGQVLSQWMTAGIQTFGPTALRNGAFTMTVEHPSGAGARYLAIAGSEDLAINMFDKDLGTWSARTPRASISAECAAVLSALRQNIAALRSVQWPGAARADVVAIISRTRAVLAVLAAPPPPVRVALLDWQLRYHAVADRIGPEGRKIRRVLGLPQVVTGQSLSR